MTMAPETNPCILRLSMLYLREEETEANGDTRASPACPRTTQPDSITVMLGGVGTDIFLAQGAKAQRLRDSVKTTPLVSGTAGL